MTSTSATRHKVHPAWLLLIAWLAFLVLLLAATGVRPARYIKVHDGRYWTWYAPEHVWSRYGDEISRFFDYADRVYEALRENLGVEPRERVYLLVHPGGAGFAGFAVGDIMEIRAVTGRRSPGIGVVYDAFIGEAYGVRGYWAYVLIAHEATNLFTGEGVTGGWPWADGTDIWGRGSPFPYAVAVLVTRQLGLEQVSSTHYRILDPRDRPYVDLFIRIVEERGWGAIRRMFHLMLEGGVRLDAQGPISSEPLKSHYVFLYLSLGYGSDLAEVLAEHRLPVNRTLLAELFGAYANRSCDPESWRLGYYERVLKCARGS
ncbi:MAG: hypothetical protein QXT37_09140 [Thermofilaceae archaeon]